MSCYSGALAGNAFNVDREFLAQGKNTFDDKCDVVC